MTTKTKRTTFVSGVTDLRLVKVPQRRFMNERGEWDTTDGEAVSFAPSGQFSTEDPDLIKWLRGHRLFNALGQTGHFVEMGKEPDRQLPTVEDLVLEITQAAVKKDADRLAEIIVAERNTHSRDAVLEPATQALVALDADQPEPDPTPAHELPRGRTPEERAELEKPVEFASEQAEKAAEGRTDLVGGGGSGKDGAYTVADIEGK